MYHIHIFLSGTGLAPNVYHYIDVQSFYGLLGWTDMVCISEPVHLGEHVWTHIIQIFIFNGIYHFTKQRKQTLLFLVQSGSELIFLQSTP